MIGSQKRFLFIFFLCFVHYEVHAGVHHLPVVSKTLELIQGADYNELGSNAFSYKKSLPTIENIVEQLALDGSVLANLTTDCASDISLMVADAMDLFQNHVSTNFTETLLKLIDSSGKPGAGILLGNKKWYGLFKECQAIEYGLENRTFEGRYNQISYAIGGANEQTCAGRPFVIDLCLPKSCSTVDIQTLIDGVSGKSIVCNVVSLPHEAHANAGTWITLAVIAVVLFLGVTASVYDYFVLPCHKDKPYTKSLWMRCWRSFSLYTNVVEIFNTKGANKPGNIGPIHCMRFFSMCWVVMGHGMALFLLSSINPLNFIEMQKHRIFGIINNSFFSVDTFFWQSGLLLTFVWLKKHKENKKQVMSPLAWTLFYVHRIVRLSPAYYLVIAFYTFIYMPFGTKNMSVNATFDADSCSNNWWINFIYLNNFIRYKEQCYSISWYLSTDMQMFVFTPLILIPLGIKKIYGVIVALVVILLSTGANVFQMYHYYFPPTISVIDGGVDPRMTVDSDMYTIMMYDAPWIRCQVYIVGMLTGILLRSVKKLRISFIVQILGWIMTVAIAYGCLFTLKGYFNGDIVPLGWRTLFSAASKPLWGVALSWIVITCYYGYGSFINSFMSWTIWVPLGRLTYSTYLIHIIVINYLVGQNQQLFVFANFFQMFTMAIVPMIFCSLIFAVFWMSAFELGFGKLKSVLINYFISRPKPIPVHPRASTLDPPVPETPPTESDVIYTKQSDSESNYVTNPKQQSNETVEIHTSEEPVVLKSIKSLKNYDNSWN